MKNRQRAERKRRNNFLGISRFWDTFVFWDLDTCLFLLSFLIFKEITFLKNIERLREYGGHINSKENEKHL